MRKYSRRQLDAIAKRHRLATISQLEELHNNIQDALETVKRKARYNPKDLQRDLVRWRLSKGATEILNDMKRRMMIIEF